MNKRDLVSVIVTTKNEASHLASLLQSVQAQTYTAIEIIVVDNNSSDTTKHIAKGFTPFVFDVGPERSAQRNYGARKAKGKYIVFLDADMILTKDIIYECVREMNDIADLRAIVIPEKSIGQGFWATCKALERSCYVGVDWMEAARFYQKEMFFQLGGYNEKLTGPEDFELSQRLIHTYGKQTVGRIGSYILHDEGKLSLAELLKKKYYYGREMRSYKSVAESKRYFVKQSNIIARYGVFISHFGILIKDPIHAMGMIYMKTLEMIALGLGAMKG